MARKRLLPLCAVALLLAACFTGGVSMSPTEVKPQAAEACAAAAKAGVAQATEASAKKAADTPATNRTAAKAAEATAPAKAAANETAAAAAQATASQTRLSDAASTLLSFASDLPYCTMMWDPDTTLLKLQCEADALIMLLVVLALSITIARVTRLSVPAKDVMLPAQTVACSELHAQPTPWSKYDAIVMFTSLSSFVQSKQIDILQSACTQLNIKETHELRIVAVVGLLDKGKTFLINTLFGKSLPACKLHATQGLSFVYVPDRKMLVVDTAGIQSTVSFRPEHVEPIVDAQTTEAWEWMNAPEVPVSMRSPRPSSGRAEERSGWLRQFQDVTAESLRAVAGLREHSNMVQLMIQKQQPPTIDTVNAVQKYAKALQHVNQQWSIVQSQHSGLSGSMDGDVPQQACQSEVGPQAWAEVLSKAACAEMQVGSLGSRLQSLHARSGA